MGIINAIIEFFKSLFGLNKPKITNIDKLTIIYLKNFRTGTNTEIVVTTIDVLKNAAANGAGNALKGYVTDDMTAKYIFAEYDPAKDDVLRIETANSADDKIMAAIEKADNNILVIS